MRSRARVGGFTLIEVLVALIIVAFGMGALLATLAGAADTAGHLRDKSLARWIAMNRISELRLRSVRPGVGKTSDDVEYAGQKWRWYQEVVDLKFSGLLQINIGVLPASAVSPKDSTPPEPLAIGFMGTSLTPASGVTPDWSTHTLAGLPPGTGGDGKPQAAPVPTPNPGVPAQPAAGEQ